METELKLAFSSEEELISSVSAPWFCDSVKILGQKQENYSNGYFDTKDRLMHKARTSVRVRHIEGAGYVHTVKTSPVAVNGQNDPVIGSGLSSRCEWNICSDRSFFDPEAFLQAVDRSGDPLPILQAALLPVMERELAVICRTEFARITIKVEFEGSILEVCLDIGKCLATNKSLPICEMEIELIEGEVDSVRKLGAIVAEHCHCSGGGLSKYARCLLLLSEEES